MVCFEILKCISKGFPRFLHSPDLTRTSWHWDASQTSLSYAISWESRQIKANDSHWKLRRHNHCDTWVKFEFLVDTFWGLSLATFRQSQIETSLAYMGLWHCFGSTGSTGKNARFFCQCDQIWRPRLGTRVCVTLIRLKLNGSEKAIRKIIEFGTDFGSTVVEHQRVAVLDGTSLETFSQSLPKESESWS